MSDDENLTLYYNLFLKTRARPLSYRKNFLFLSFCICGQRRKKK